MQTTAIETVSVNHTYTMTTYSMTINGQEYIIREGYDPNSGDQEIRQIHKILGPHAHNSIPNQTEEWLRLEKLFQQNRSD